jgi:hypothetical protein
MIAIGDVLISDDIIEKNFICNLNSCKGACCWKGDYGAPITEAEAKIIEENLEIILEYLPKESVQYLSKNKTAKFYKEADLLGTPLLKNKACVYLTFEEKGIGYCGIEKAYLDNKINFKKPISCHLYPIRVLKNEEQGFEAWNYEKWNICKAACKLGDEHQVRIYTFVKDAIIRYKGKEFYDELEAYVANQQ